MKYLWRDEKVCHPRSRFAYSPTHGHFWNSAGKTAVVLVRGCISSNSIPRSFRVETESREERQKKKERKRYPGRGIFAASRVVLRGRPCSWQLTRVYFREWRILLPPQHFCASFYQLKSTLSSRSHPLVESNGRVFLNRENSGRESICSNRSIVILPSPISLWAQLNLPGQDRETSTDISRN